MAQQLTVHNETDIDETTVIAAPGAGLRLYILSGSIHNANSAQIECSLLDGAAGTPIWLANLAADGGGSLFNFRDLDGRGFPLPVNQPLVIDMAAAGNVDVNVVHYVAN